MKELDRLNSQYVLEMDIVSTLIGYRSRINDGQNYAGNALSKVNNGKVCLRELISKLDCSKFELILETKELCDKYE